MGETFDQFDSLQLRKLESVQMWAHPDLPDVVGVIRFSFSDFVVFVCIEDDYDELLCTRKLPESYADYNLQITSGFWSSVLGKTLISAWRMTNDRGYSDALQLKFRDMPDAGSYTDIQLCAEASRISLTEIQIVRSGP